MVGDRLRSTALASSRWRDARWLVIAPHPDDETLGCGALIAETSARRQLAGVAFLTDGGASHTCDTPQDRGRLVALRRNEARGALRVLAPQAPSPIFLGWPDANPHRAGSEAHAATIQRISAFCAVHRVDAIAVTGRDEPHCDHVAAFDAAQRAASTALRPIDVFEYVVWAKASPGADFAVVRSAALASSRRRRALAQHRSQLTPLYGKGFCVPDSMRRMQSADLLYLKVRQ